MSAIRLLAAGAVLTGTVCAALGLASCQLAFGVDRSLVPPDADPSTGGCGCQCVADPLPSCLGVDHDAGDDDGSLGDADATVDAAADVVNDVADAPESS